MVLIAFRRYDTDCVFCTGGVVQYDKGRSLDDGQFIRKGHLNRPPTSVLTALQSLMAEHERQDSRMSTYLSEMIQKNPRMKEKGYFYPGAEKDQLHSAGSLQADSSIIVERQPRPDNNPQVHYGTIASGSRVVMNATERDRLRTEFGARCVEMEAAGLMNNFPCIVIRGISDYADSHKDFSWQKYAAAAAAAYAKEFLCTKVSAAKTRREEPIRIFLEQ